MVTLARSFHNSIDLGARAYQVYTPQGVWRPGGRYFTTRQRSVSYQFFPHFHPYVSGSRASLANVAASQLSLIRRLDDGGLAELQDSDTLYMPQPNPGNGNALQPLTVLPGSTRATLAANASGTRPDGTAVNLLAGTPLTLPDGTTAIVPAGTTIAHPDGSTATLPSAISFQLPGQIPVSSASGIQIPGTDIIVPDTTLVTITLPAGAYAALTDDGSQAQLPAGTSIAIRSGMPQPLFYEPIFDSTHYNPTGNVQEPYPVKNLDFTYNGAYSIYNWEIFFHAPLLVAIHLSQNQKFQEAQNWFHYIFDPTDNSPGPTPERFWKVQPFQYTDVTMIEQILVNLSTGQDQPLQQQTISSITDWMQNPFQPWAVAKYRPTAYMLKTVMAYLDNLIAWGDSLFQQYTIETINEATQIYIMAANILGKKPQPVPAKGAVKPLTYNDLRGDKLDAFGNTMVDMEVDIPFDIVAPAGSGASPNGTQILPSLGQTLYFCIPRNDQLLAYWDTVADRLFKIHNSLNIQGVFQQLPLYDPPIDPALLVRAAAAGLDVGAIVSGLNQPLPLVRFQLLASKATEICQEVKSLGGNLLAAVEKQDNESLSLLRAQHESAILALSEMVKYAQWQDARKATQALQLSLAAAAQRYSYYQKLLGRSDAQIKSSIPQLDSLDLGSLQNLNFSQGEASSEPVMALDPINPDIAQNSLAVSDGGIATLTNHEAEELTKLQDAQSSQETAATWDKTGAVGALIPEFGIHGTPFGVGGTASFGGHNLAALAQAFSTFNKSDAEKSTYEANKTAKLGAYSRREQEWMFQGNSAKAEINQIQKQIRGAQIREAIAQKEYATHQAQMQNAQQITDFLQGNQVDGGFQIKETTIGFYAWMKREVKALYAGAFQSAFDVAKKAERALQNELGDPSLTYIRYNYLDGIGGLLAGEKLFLDIKTMEMAYHDLNQREYELTKHASLLQIDPLALVQLRATGTCSFSLPEDAFDLDNPGHYFRRIKSVALTLPCIAGPYTSVSCTLTLQKSAIRIGTGLPDGKYARQGSDDIRFNDYYGTIQSIVTSSAQSDSGLFEANLRDERYLPFEGAGAAGSQWQLSLPADIPQFGFDAITDAVLHVRYTAREGGDALKTAATANLHALIDKGQTVGSVCLFSIRHEFPSQWAKFRGATISGATPTAELQLTLTPEHYPFWAQDIVSSKNPVKAIEFFAEMLPGGSASVTINDKPDQSGNTATLARNLLLGNLLSGDLGKILPPATVTDPAQPPFTIFFNDNAMEDLWIAVIWGKG